MLYLCHTSFSSQSPEEVTMQATRHRRFSQGPADMHKGFEISPPSLPIERASEIRILERRLDLWCRTHGERTTLNSWIAERAHDEQPRPSDRWRSITAPTIRPSCEVLPDRLSQWPASWRYRVADVERTGVSRAEAVQKVRHEHRQSSATTSDLMCGSRADIERSA
jgi:hypothetical protein